MAKPQLKAQPRPKTGSHRLRHLRRAGLVPAVLYGKDEKTVPLAVEQSALEAVIRAKTRMIDLEVEGKVHTTFLREVQIDPIEESLLHVDFHHVRMDQVLRVKVSLHLKGVPAGTQEGGVVNQLLHEVQVECLPADLPEVLECPIAHLKLDESLHLKDLTLPPRVKPVGDPETVVVSVQKPKEDVPAAAAPGEGEAKEPELIKKERAEAEGEEGKEAPKEGGKEKGKAEPAKGGKPEEGKK